MTDTTGNLLAIIADIRQALGTPDEVHVREYARTVADKAQKWDAVPWNVLYGVVYGMGDDCIDDMRQWFLMHAPQEARG